MRRAWKVSAWSFALMLVFGLGCAEKPEPGAKPSPTLEKTPTAGETKAPVETKPAPKAESKPVEPPAKPTIPEVKLTQSLEATCLVKVGDLMPHVTLPKLDGQAVELKSLFGPKLTVVVFWQSDHLYSLEELIQLKKHVFAPYNAKGVAVIAINEDDPAPVAGKNFRKTGATFPCILDPQRKYFLQVATEKLPRTYLLDDAGRVLWFDIEYSRSMQRDLLQAIDVALGEK